MFSVVRICNKSEYLVQISNRVKICHKIFLYKDQLYLKIATCVISFTIMKFSSLQFFSSTEKYLSVWSCFKYSSFLTKALKISSVSFSVFPWRSSFLSSLNWKADYRKKNFKTADLFWPYIYGWLCFLFSTIRRTPSRYTYFPKQTTDKYVKGMTSAKPCRLL